MAGIMYLGNQKVTPVIIQGSGDGGYSELPSYQVVNGVPQKAAFELKGTEFSNITEVPANFFKEYFKGFTGLTGVVDFSSLTTIGQEGLFGAFQGCTGITGINFSSLTTVGQWGFSNTFIGCTGLSGNIDLSSITTAVGFNRTFKGCTGIKSVDLSSWTGNNSGSVYAVEMFSGCTNLESVDFSSLKRIEGNFAFEETFNGCSKLKNIVFPLLEEIVGYDTFPSCFSGCLSLETVRFPALKKAVNFYAMFYEGCDNLKDIYFNSLDASLCPSDCFMGMLDTTNGVTIHFSSNQQSAIQEFDGYPNFGGTNVTIAFDLPPTS